MSLAASSRNVILAIALVAVALAAVILAGIELSRSSSPAISGRPPNPAVVGSAWTWELSGFHPNSELNVTCNPCGGNAAPINQCVTDDPSTGCVYTDSGGRATVTEMMGPHDFGAWTMRVCDSEGACTPWENYNVACSAAGPCT